MKALRNDEARGQAGFGTAGVGRMDGPDSATVAAESKSRHPLSAAFGNMSEDQFTELISDIKQNGLLTAITTAEDGSILDGWHRYRACIEAGVKPRFEPFAYVVEPATEQSGKKPTEAEFVCSQNAHRRHLTAEQRRGIVAELLKADPTKSDRAIATMAKVSHVTVGAARRELESTGQIDQLPATTGLDGKTRTKPPAKPRARRFANLVVADGVEVLAPPSTTAPPQRRTDAEDAVSPGAPAAPAAKPIERHPVLRGMSHLNPLQQVENAARMLSVAAAVLGDIRLEDLDRGSVNEILAEMRKSLTLLSKFVRRAAP